jgi:hypothetical protein
MRKIKFHTLSLYKKLYIYIYTHTHQNKQEERKKEKGLSLFVKGENGDFSGVYLKKMKKKKKKWWYKLTRENRKHDNQILGFDICSWDSFYLLAQ